jgi:hypothetical protein
MTPYTANFLRLYANISEICTPGTDDEPHDLSEDEP